MTPRLPRFGELGPRLGQPPAILARVMPYRHAYSCEFPAGGAAWSYAVPSSPQISKSSPAWNLRRMRCVADSRSIFRAAAAMVAPPYTRITTSELHSALNSCFGILKIPTPRFTCRIHHPIEDDSSGEAFGVHEA